MAKKICALLYYNHTPHIGCSHRANLHDTVAETPRKCRTHDLTRTLPVKSMPLPMVMAVEEAATGLADASATEGALHVTVDHHKQRALHREWARATSGPARESSTEELDA